MTGVMFMASLSYIREACAVSVSQILRTRIAHDHPPEFGMVQDRQSSAIEAERCSAELADVAGAVPEDVLRVRDREAVHHRRSHENGRRFGRRARSAAIRRLVELTA